MLRWMVLGFGLVVFSAEARATGEITCAGKGVGVDLLVGHVDVLSVARAVVTIGEKVWSSTPESWPGIPISVGQGFEDERQLFLDIVDEGYSVIGRLRVFKATEGDKSVAGGVFTWKDRGAFVIDCSEPE